MSDARRWPIAAMLAGGAIAAFGGGVAAAQTPPPTMVLPPAPPIATTPVSATRQALSLELATLMNSRELTRRQSSKMFDESIPKLFAGNEDFKELEADYPGFTQHVIGKMRGVVEAQVDKGLPDLWQRLATVYAARMDDAELRAALAFYRTPTGSKIMGAVADGTDITALGQKFLDDENAQVTPEDLRKATVGSALPTMLQRLNPDDLKAIVAFSATPAGRKIRLMQADMLAIGAAWSNESTPEEDKALEDVITGAMEEFMGRDDKGGTVPKDTY